MLFGHTFSRPPRSARRASIFTFGAGNSCIGTSVRARWISSSARDAFNDLADFQSAPHLRVHSAAMRFGRPEAQTAPGPSLQSMPSVNLSTTPSGLRPWWSCEGEHIDRMFVVLPQSRQTDRFDQLSQLLIVGRVGMATHSKSMTIVTNSLVHLGGKKVKCVRNAPSGTHQHKAYAVVRMLRRARSRSAFGRDG